MGLKCILGHHFGLPHLDAAGVVWYECMRCGKQMASQARISLDTDGAAEQKHKLDRAIATLGHEWVGRPSNDRPDARFRAHSDTDHAA